MESQDFLATDANSRSYFNYSNDLLHSDDGPQTCLFDMLMAVLYLGVCVVGLAGNSLVIVTILKLHKMETATTVYIFNLALADGLFMVGMPFLALQNFRHSWIFGDFACKLVMILDGINQFTSVFCLTVMSIDRYMAVVNPIRFSKWRTPRRAKIISVFLWFFSLLPVLPMAVHFTAGGSLCSLEPPGSLDTWRLAFIIYTFTLGFALPFFVMSLCYASLVVNLKAGLVHFQNTETKLLEEKMTKMVVAVVLGFAICWLPFYVFNFYMLWHPGDFTPAMGKGFEFIVLLSYSWSCANPILYACLSEKYRKHFHILLCPKKRSQSLHFDANTDGYDLNDLSGWEIMSVV
ncbi:somatostatin receptor type 2 [Amia ocellicauda]|uniref:somatostatin receptor type 2 n=1 Tax=Amia ocellicauda TaxID=2972642 RepID=UPI0034643A2B